MKRRFPVGRTVTLGVTTALGAGGWVAFFWLEQVPRYSVKYFVGGHSSTWWGALCLIVASGATLLAAGLLANLALGSIRTRPVRIAVGVVATLTWTAGAVFFALLCWFALFGVEIEGTQTLVTADDGTTLMITQDGFDGDIVVFYDPGHGGAWIRRPESAAVDPREGPCTLAATSVSTLTITCGSKTQSLARTR